MNVHGHVNNLTQTTALKQKIWAFVFIYCITSMQVTEVVH